MAQKTVTYAIAVGGGLLIGIVGMSLFAPKKQVVIVAPPAPAMYASPSRNEGRSYSGGPPIDPAQAIVLPGPQSTPNNRFSASQNQIGSTNPQTASEIPISWESVIYLRWLIDFDSKRKDFESRENQKVASLLTQSMQNEMQSYRYGATNQGYNSQHADFTGVMRQIAGEENQIAQSFTYQKVPPDCRSLHQAYSAYLRSIPQTINSDIQRHEASMQAIRRGQPDPYANMPKSQEDTSARDYKQQLNMEFYALRSVHTNVPNDIDSFSFQ